MNGNYTWKAPSLRFLLGRGSFSGKRSTPYAPGAVHDYMHAKVCVCDDRVFVGSFNLSHSGEQNAEDVLEIDNADLAERMARFVDEIRVKYPPLALD
jgi:phosphatidylserine/phosphatidylglycerophosphate/cardiolipin synthase-like enzyme